MSGQNQQEIRIASRTLQRAGARFGRRNSRLFATEGTMRRLSKTVLTAFMVSGMIAVSVPSQAEQMTKDQLVGTWQAVSFKTTTGDQVGYPLGQYPGGYLGFTPTRFWVMLVDTTRKAPAASAMTEAEANSAM